MSNFLDRVRETFTTTGTGTISLGGAATGFRTFVAALGGGGTVFYFAIGAAGGADADNWEFGHGTLTDASPDTLTRTLIASSSGALISWAAGTKHIMSASVASVLMGWARPYRGTSRPAWLPQGGLWFDTDDGSLYSYDGTDDIRIGTVDETNNVFVPEIAGLFALKGVISPAQLTANTDNWAPTGLATANTIRVSTDASRNLTGISAPSPATQKALLLQNVGSNDLVLVHDATSTAANRFYCPNSANFTLKANSAVWLFYDATSSRWRVVENAALVSGGEVQRARTEKTDTFEQTGVSGGTWYAITGLSATLNGVADGNNVRIRGFVCIASPTSGVAGALRIKRGSTVLLTGTASGSRQAALVGCVFPQGNQMVVVSFDILDLDPGAGNFTYSVEAMVDQGANIRVNHTGNDSDASTTVRAASVLEAIEVKP